MILNKIIVYYKYEIISFYIINVALNVFFRFYIE